jgi:hypothetical protein
MTRTTLLNLTIAAALVVGAGACAKSGMGATVRTDVAARMDSTRPAITECYATQLKLDRKIRGMIVLKFVAAASTGAFSNIEVLRDDLGNDAIRKCVLDQVATLKLETPQKSAISITYPLDFAPVK